MDGEPFSFFCQRFDRAGKKVERIIQRKQCPEACKDFPVLDTEDGEKRSGKQDDTYRSPAVKGVQQAHDALLMFERAGFDDRAYQHFDQSASHSIDNDAD